MGRFETLLVKMLRLVSERKVLHYSELASECHIGASTASQYASMLASKYPDHIEYSKGHLKLKKPVTSVDLPRETLEHLIDEMDEKERKLRENHIPHLEKIAENHKLEDLKNEVKRLKETLEGGS